MGLKRSKYVLTASLLILSYCKITDAHDGPPFPIVVDQRVGPCIISVWTDPDIGQGTFFIITQDPGNGSIPDDLTVQVSVQPTSGRLPEATYETERQNLPAQVQYKAIVNFDAGEMWRVRVNLKSSKGNGETTAVVEATPEGLGRWDLLLYLLPFLAIGYLWLRAFLSHKKAHKTQNS